MAKTRLAKLSPPRGTSWLERARLHRLLDRMAERSVVWLAAEPGAGKSTLAISWAASRAGNVLWYRVDDGDANPGETFSYFTELARTGRRAAPAVPTYQARDLDRLDVFARSFFRAFFAVIPAASTLVLDDVHTASGSDFDQLLAAVVQEVPPDVSVLILSRNDPAGALLEEVTRGSIWQLQGTEIAFTSQEAADLLAGRVDRKTAHRLHAQTDGWVAGLLLLADAQGGNRPSGTLSARQRVESFFADRVLALLGESSQRILAAASLLPEVDVAGLREMGFGEDAVDLLERMRQSHSFVTRLDREPASWRLHDLLRDVLRERIHTIGDVDWRRQLRHAASRVAAQRGLARDAVQLAIDAGEVAGATAIAGGLARDLAKAQRLTELDGVAAALGPDAAARNLALQIALGEGQWQRNNAQAAVTHFERAFAILDQPPPSATGLLLSASALRAILEGWQDYADLETWVRRLGEHLGARPKVTDDNEGLRVDSTHLCAMHILWMAEFGDQRALIERILEVLRQRSRDIDPNEAVAASGVLIEAAGYRLSDANLFRDIVQATAPWLQRPELAPLSKAGWLTNYAALGRRWPTPGVKLPAPDPVACLELAVDMAREHGGRSTAFTGLVFLANLAVANNDQQAAQRHLAAMRDAVEPQHPSQTVSLLNVEAGVWALQGEWTRAQASVEHALHLADQSDFPASQRWSTQMGQQRIAIASDRAAQAQAALRLNATTYAEGLYRDFALILADVAAAAEALQQDKEVPSDLVRTIMQRAREYDWPGFATLLAPIAARLCAAALKLGIEPEFARQVVRERNLPAPSRYERHWPWPIRIHALGGLTVEVGDKALAFGPRAQRKPLDLLKVLISHGPSPVDAAVLYDALWPDAEGGAARASFDMTLMRLRKMLGRDDAVSLDAGRVGLDSSCVWVDAFAYAQGAIDDYPGPLFGADTVQPWWAAARERLHQRFLRRARERGAGLEQTRQFDEALSLYEAGLAQDALAEDLYQGAIRCHLAAGRASDALRLFRRCRDQLSIILGVAPSAATVALVAGLSRG